MRSDGSDKERRDKAITPTMTEIKAQGSIKQKEMNFYVWSGYIRVTENHSTFLKV